MICRHCGTEIADKAIVCYRCGTATTDPVRRSPVRPAGRGPRTLLMVVVMLAMVGAGTIIGPMTPHGPARLGFWAALVVVTVVTVWRLRWRR